MGVMYLTQHPKATNDSAGLADETDLVGVPEAEWAALAHDLSLGCDSNIPISLYVSSVAIVYLTYRLI